MTSSSESFSMEKAGLSLSWDSESQQKQLNLSKCISLRRQATGMGTSGSCSSRVCEPQQCRKACVAQGSEGWAPMGDSRLIPGAHMDNETANGPQQGWLSRACPQQISLPVSFLCTLHVATAVRQGCCAARRVPEREGALRASNCDGQGSTGWVPASSLWAF